MLCLSGFELYSRWVPLKYLDVERFAVPALLSKLLFPVDISRRKEVKSEIVQQWSGREFQDVAAK